MAGFGPVADLPVAGDVGGGAAVPLIQEFRQDRMGPVGMLGVPPGVFSSDFRIKFVGNVAQKTTRIRITQVSVEAWVSSSRTPTIRTTQFSAEIWFQNYRQTSRGFYYPKDRMGPVGFLGVPVATFKDRLTLQTYDPNSRPDIGPNSIPSEIIQMGPKGFLGIPPRKFREAGFTSLFGSVNAPDGGGITPSTASLIGTQFSAEIWISSDFDTYLHSTQASAEIWISSDRTPYTWITQASLEVWISSDIPPVNDFIPAFLWVD